MYVYTLSHWETNLAQKLGFTGEDKKKFETLLTTLNDPKAEPFKSVNAIFTKLSSVGNEKLMKDLKVQLWKINDNDIPWETARLNKFVSDQTNGMITNLFTEGNISSAQEIFVNTMYFKWDWASSFDPKKNKIDQKFWDKKADLMNQTSNFDTTTTKTAQVVKMPFKDGSSLVAFLPNGDLWATISEANQLLKNPNTIKFENEKIDLTFPKFTTESTALWLWNKLWLDVDIIQKSKVIVNETWAKAAAATAVTTRGMSLDPKINFDKPFYYAIQDKAGNTHFMGTYEGKQS